MKMIVKLEPCYPLVVHDQIEKVSEMKYLLKNSDIITYDILISYDYLINVTFQVVNPFVCMEDENQMIIQQPNFQRWWMTIVISQIDMML